MKSPAGIEWDPSTRKTRSMGERSLHFCGGFGSLSAHSEGIKSLMISTIFALNSSKSIPLHSPFSPLGPLGPWTPGAPCTPSKPSLPDTPLVPLAPGTPSGPCGPATLDGSPFSPFIPATPSRPRGRPSFLPCPARPGSPLDPAVPRDRQHRRFRQFRPRLVLPSCLLGRGRRTDHAYLWDRRYRRDPSLPRDPGDLGLPFLLVLP